MPSLYEDVPRTNILENLEYRRDLLQWCDGNKRRQQVLFDACSEDSLFFMNSFCWMYEPRNRYDHEGNLLPKSFPMMTWVHQEPVVLEIEENLGVNDIALSKSRGEGASWLISQIMARRWCCHPYTKFGLSSYNERMMDDPTNPDSLFWKIDHTIKMLPNFLTGIEDKEIGWDRNISKHTLFNARNNSVISGYPTTEVTGTGGRCLAFILDELGKYPRPMDDKIMTSVQQVTDCRVCISTPYGPTGAYYNIMHQQHADVVRLHLNWKRNPTRNRYLYKVLDGQPHPITNEGLHPDYADPEKWQKIQHRLLERGYTIETTVRSPWYDKQCLRPLANPRNIAQELDEDFGGSVSRFFNVVAIQKHIDRYSKEPLHIGKLDFKPEKPQSVRFVPDPTGPLKIWCKLDVNDRPPADEYVVSADIAAGTGGTSSSNSSASIGRRRDNRKVAELTSPIILPHNFADICIALCYFFADWAQPGEMIWEDNGPTGAQFRSRIMQSAFRRFFWRNAGEDTASKKKTRKPGFWTEDRQTKPKILGDLNLAYERGEFHNPSKYALMECLEYLVVSPRSGTGSVKIVHSGAIATDDPAAAGDAHGDRVIADALLWYRLRDTKSLNVQTAANEQRRLPPGSFGHRQMEARAKAESDARRNRLRQKRYSGRRR